MSRLALPAALLVGVVDLKDGQAVHAIAGQRHAYQPVACCAGDPMQLATLYRNRGAGALYVADLDAIEGDSPQVSLIDAILQQHRDRPVWIDLGWRESFADASGSWVQQSANAHTHAHWVAATETVGETRHLAGLSARVPAERCCLSLDYRGGVLQAIAGSPTDWIAQAEMLGFGSLIVLDIAGVGTRRGPLSLPLCRQLRPQLQRMQMISGGGVRDSADARSLIDAGCERVLVATALIRSQSD